MYNYPMGMEHLGHSMEANGMGEHHVGGLMEPHDEASLITLSTLLGQHSTGPRNDDGVVEEALSSLSPQQLLELEKNLQQQQKKKKTTSLNKKKQRGENGDPNAPYVITYPSPSTPVVTVRDGVEWITFSYTNKGRITEYTIRIDIENLNADDIPEDFKRENGVYPRAYCAPEQYEGNRWEYETTCNDIAWKLCWMNPSVLTSRRGLIQRAVDSYRNRFDDTRSRRVQRQEKLVNGTLRRRVTESTNLEPKGPKMLTFHWSTRGITSKAKIRVDIDTVDLSDIDETFKINNCVFPQAMLDRESYTSPVKCEYETLCNEIGWKLAYLNANKLAGKRIVLQKAVEAYRMKYDRGKAKDVRNLYRQELYLESLSPAQHDQNTERHEFTEMVAHALAMNNQNLDMDHHHHIHHQINMQSHHEDEYDPRFRQYHHEMHGIPSEAMVHPDYHNQQHYQSYHHEMTEEEQIALMDSLQHQSMSTADLLQNLS
ncbi:hypothetical protein ROZALSC1DRAFT_29083 [Rozella allomycis CSF55]|uniref:DUF8032 domain-containing protein n=1 Tax=Rozella allomycis (strain CSF55) TaxID=988480 RepID=A0A075B5D1_ROZAC|nr:hypothetical protein O9G_001426 [Rozella allomycis CSF55]RKP19307.1 hypothetical protein ROZALSC1DRAFT_29083 [Rozella allomycis CSF55]|eukprot:EPZ36981.1 hypothetical protein O9G_001426 [Rozella allomycis CSF55]